MNRNTITRFGSNPVNLTMERSRFKIPTGRKFTFNNGDLIPIFHMPVLPGDTIELKMAELVRMQTPIFPVMDNMYLDTYFFFVPDRLVWDHFEEFMGENKDGTWRQETERTIPKLYAPQGGWEKGSLADYMGWPTNVSGIDVSSLPLKAYVKVWNDWFRDENRKEPALITTTDDNLNGVNPSDANYSYITGAQLGGAPLKAARLSGYFENSLIYPQKGPDVFIPLGGSQGLVPVYTGAGIPGEFTQNKMPLHWVTSNPNTQMPTGGLVSVPYASSGNNYATEYLKQGSISGSGTSVDAVPSNLWADLAYDAGGTANQSTINNLRTAFAIQRHYEKLRRAGSRYIEMTAALFGRHSADARLQRAEYLGGTRTMVQMEGIVQTSSTDDTSPQGNVSGNSKTVFTDRPFIHSFTEHGRIIGVQVTRVLHSYQQGINRLDRAYDLFDWYFPSLRHIGEQPIYNYEIFAQGSNVTDSDGNIVDDQVAGYQEAWRAYRFMPRIIAGELRSNYAQSLDAWHYRDYYTELPILTSSEWIDEPKENVDRTLAVDSDTSDQFLADIDYEIIATRPMPVYSVPGLIDHY